MKPALVKRLERLLVLIPWVARHRNGVPAEKAMEFAGYGSLRELQDDIELAGQIALPPEAPDDFLDLCLEDGRVFVTLPQGFQKPPRLSVNEAAALLAAARPLSSSGRVVASAIRKLTRALPPGAEAELEPLSRAAAIETAEPPPCREVLQDAVAGRCEVELDYVGGSTGERSTKRVEPRLVFSHRGRWYLAALDGAADEEKLYRLDRMVEVRLTGRRFEPQGPPDARRFERDFLYFASGAERDVEVVFTKSIAPFVRERWGELCRERGDGAVSVTVRAAGDNYILSWVSAFGGTGTIVAPEDLRRRLAERVEKTRRRYART